MRLVDCTVTRTVDPAFLIHLQSLFLAQKMVEECLIQLDAASHWYVRK